MTAIQDFLESHFEQFKDDILFADGFEDAFMGIVTNKGHKPTACYDYQKCLEILREREGMSNTEAVEFMNYNVTDAYVGEYTPSFVDRFDTIKEHYGHDEGAWGAEQLKERIEFFEDTKDN